MHQRPLPGPAHLALDLAGAEDPEGGREEIPNRLPGLPQSRPPLGHCVGVRAWWHACVSVLVCECE